MPLLYFSGASQRVGIYYASSPDVGDPGYKPPPMPVGRRGADAAPIGESQAVVLGGADSSGNPGNHNQLFALTSWATRAAVPVARWNHRVERLPDGRVIFLGGLSTAQVGSVTATVYIYDPNTDSWATGPSMPQAKAHFASAVLDDGRVWVAAGAISTADRSATTHLLAPSTMTWSTGASVPRAIGYLNGHTPLPGNKAAIVGGFGNTDTQVNTALKYLYIYDGNGNTYSVGPDMPTARYLNNAQRMETSLVVIGGLAGGFSRANEEFDPIANAWRINPDVPVNISQSGTTRVRGIMFCFGDYSDQSIVLAYWP